MAEVSKENQEKAYEAVEIAKKTGKLKKGVNEVKLEDGSKRLTFSEGSLVYIDTYYGFNPFIGQELVLLQNKPIWGMNYSGEIVSPNLKSEEVYAFLKEALGQVSVTFPFRGPQQYQNRNFRILSGSRYISQISC